MKKNILFNGELFINYLGPFSALLGNLICTPILISNLGIKEWSLFALINILLPLVSLVLAGKGFFVGRLMINIFLGNEKTKKSIEIFYNQEKKIFFRFIISTVLLTILLILLNSGKYPTFEGINLTFFLISTAVFVKIFEQFNAFLLNGLKQHYRLQISGGIVTLLKWIVIIYLALQNDTKINTIIVVLIVFSLLLIITQRLFILNYFKMKTNIIDNLNKKINLKFDEKNFQIVIFLLLLMQQFYNVLIFGILDPIRISYFGIALMISVSIPLIYSPIRGYLTPEINEKGELKSKDRIKYYAIFFIIQFGILLVLFLSVNFFLEEIIILWIGETLNINEISIFLIPLSMCILSKELLETLKVLYVSENIISYMKNSIIIIFLIFIFFIILLYKEVISPETYLYCGSISIFLLTLYLIIIFFKNSLLRNAK